MEFDLSAVYLQFQSEAEEQLSAMEEGLLSLEREASSETLQALFRLAHSLKGNAGMLGLDEIAALAEKVEDLLDGLREGRLVATSSLTTLMFRSLDALRTAVRATTQRSAPANTELLAELSAAKLPPQETQTPAPDVPRTLRVSISHLDRLLNLSGELSVACEALSRSLGQGASVEDLRERGRELERLAAELQHHSREVRLVPVGPLLRSYARVARDAALSHQREVELVLSGQDATLDAAIVEQLKDPLTHMVRNAVAHGIESPAERRACGKPPCGVVSIALSPITGGVLLSVSDDGRGFSLEKIRARAREMGLAADQLSEAELHQLTLSPGFSTADTVNALSGRGVGMDVVRERVEALRGALSIESQPSRGSRVTMRLPQTLLLVEGFVVELGGERYLLPRDSILSCAELPASCANQARGMLHGEGGPIPFLDLRAMLRAPGVPAARQSVVIVRYGSESAGLVIDGLHEEIKGVLKPLGPLLRGLRWFSGATVLADGVPALILDTSALLRDGLRGGA